MTTDLSSAIALVTGASRGLGFAVAQQLAEQGAQVIALARTAGGLEALDDAITEHGGTAPILVPLDITKSDEVAGLTAALASRVPQIDLWVHTAVYAPALAPVAQTDPKDLDRAVTTNLTAVQGLIAAIDPLFRQSSAGRAVFLHDPAAPGVHAAYIASKAGGEALARGWGAALARTGPGRLIIATPPPMPTAVRARFHPGEDTAALTPTYTVAERLLKHLANGAEGDVTLFD